MTSDPIIGDYPTIDISTWLPEGVEDSGTNNPEWFRNPETGEKWLFKESGNEINGLHGKDWAEKIVYEVGVQLDLPCSQTELAISRLRFGSISKNFLGTGIEMLSGSQLISEIYPDFNAREKARRHHNLDVIQQVLTAVNGSIRDSDVALDGFDVFVGFLLLDAITASGDRHSENWGVLTKSTGPVIAPSWDHGNSLAFDLLESGRRKWQNRGITSFAIKGKPSKFEGGNNITLVDLAVSGLQRVAPSVRKFWVERVHSLTPEALQGILSRVPRMSEGERIFAIQLMVINRGRLLDEFTSSLH